MVKTKRRWPEIGEYVIGTISRVESHGAYAILDEYNNSEGMIHISEVAASWVRNIRNFVRERQKVVAKVLNVNPNKGHIDLSLRRVSKNMKKQKVKQWKRSQKAENLLELSLTKYNEINNTSKTLDDAYNEVGWKMEELFGDILGGFEESKQKGQKILSQKDIPIEWTNIITDIAQIYVEIPQVKITGMIEIQSYKSDGIQQIKQFLTNLIEKAPEDVEIKISLVGSPKYYLTATSMNYKNIEKYLKIIPKEFQKNKFVFGNFSQEK